MQKFRRSLLVCGAGLLLVACNSNKGAVKTVDAVENAEKTVTAAATDKVEVAADAKTESAVEKKATDGSTDKATVNTLTDKSGHTYKTVRMGDKLWTAENIREQSGVTCQANTVADADFINKYGCLYSWDDAQKVCPSEQGWRLPSKDDYLKMIEPLGDSPKSRCKALCVESFNGGTGSSGFAAVPAGMFAGEYNRFGQVAMLWTATGSEESQTDANYVLIDPSFMGVGIFDAAKTTGYSVRCVKDAE